MFEMMSTHHAVRDFYCSSTSYIQQSALVHIRSQFTLENNSPTVINMCIIQGMRLTLLGFPKTNNHKAL
jgi:hypothetical protein